MTEHRAFSDAPERARRRSIVIGGVVAVALIVLDQATKELAESLLEPGRFVPLLGDHIGWQLVYNQGGAFGIPAPHWLFLIVTVIVVIVVGRALPRTQSKVTATAYGMLLAGALGNVVDRIFREGATDVFGGGAVVDFVAWGTFPRFNVADSAITVGFVLLVIGLWSEERSQVDEARAAEALARGASEGTGIGHVTVLTSEHETADADPALETADDPAAFDAARDDDAATFEPADDAARDDGAADAPAAEGGVARPADEAGADEAGADAPDPDDPSRR